jgi:hypothetical protein
MIYWGSVLVPSLMTLPHPPSFSIPHNHLPRKLAQRLLAIAGSLAVVGTHCGGRAGAPGADDASHSTEIIEVSMSDPAPTHSAPAGISSAPSQTFSPAFDDHGEHGPLVRCNRSKVDLYEQNTYYRAHICYPKTQERCGAIGGDVVAERLAKANISAIDCLVHGPHVKGKGNEKTNNRCCYDGLTYHYNYYPTEAYVGRPLLHPSGKLCHAPLHHSWRWL